MSSNKIMWLQDNIKAIYAAWRINNGVAEQGDTALLAAYHGWGNLKEVNAIKWDGVNNYYQFTIDSIKPVLTAGEEPALWMAVLAQLCSCIDNITDDRTKAHQVLEEIKSATLTSFYTPTPVTKAIGKAVSNTLDHFGIQSVMFLEPSAGSGAFLNTIDQRLLVQPQYAIEKDFLTATVLKAQHPEAQVLNMGFEEAAPHIPSGMFDVVASNIPFGQVRVSDPGFAKQSEDHSRATYKIHCYYMLKGMEQCKNGGIMAFITTRGIADSQNNQYVRDYLCSHGNLLAAYRLPDNLFVTSAGIEVGSDLLVWQRDDNKAPYLNSPEKMFSQSITKEIMGETIEGVNRLLSCRQQALYTDCKPQRDQYGKMVMRYTWRDTIEALATELEHRLTRDMSLYFKKSTWLIGNGTVQQTFDATRTRHTGNADALKKAREAKAAALVATDEMRQPLADLLQCLAELNSTERRTHQPQEELRQALNIQYDAWVERFGTLHHCEQQIKHLPNWQIAMTLEVQTGKGQYRKADVFVKPVTFTVIDKNYVYAPAEALAVVLNDYGMVDMTKMQQMTHMDEGELYAALKGEVYMALSEGGTPQWQHRSLTINGDVISKRKRIEQYLKENTGSEREALLTETIEALRAATPKPIPYGKDGIKLQLGARWLPTDYVERFANKIFEAEYVKVRYCEAADAIVAEDDKWIDGTVNTRGSWGVEYQSRKSFSCLEMLNYALKDKCPEIKKTVGTTQFTDHEAIRRVQKGIDRLKDEFERFMFSSRITPEDKARIETIYNEKFNCCVRASFDGSFQTLPGLSFDQFDFNSLYQSQLDLIWMIKQNGGGVGWHQVGAGKTMIMIVAAYEMSRLGLAHKPLIIGLKANVSQIADTFRKAYPNARLLYPGKDDFTEDNRVQFFNKIANNDWDCIIMTHEQFYRIPNSMEMEREILQQELDDIEEALKFANSLNNAKESRNQLRGLQMRKTNLDAKMSDLQKKMRERSDDVVDFEKMGIGHIFVDEYHNFKNLQFTTRHQRVAGLGNSAGSQKALHLLTAIRTIQKHTGRDLGATFMSGTVVANALTELYVLFKYLTPRELKRQGIYNFDAWCSTFIKKSCDYELTVAGGLKQKERFRNYINVPEMTQALRRITDYRTAAMMNLDIPHANVVFDQADPTDYQYVMLERIKQFAQTGSWAALGLDAPEPNNLKDALMLVATDVARKTSLDLRMLSDNLYGDEMNNKSSRCAARIAEYYKQYDEHRGTQFVFCDIATPNSKGWNIYDDIKHKLVSWYGIPAHEIAFIHDNESDKKKMALFSKLNNGAVRVVFGSTQKLGTGVNAQQRAVAVHHLDIPWRPADMEQRNGRAVRKGNEVKVWADNTVDIIIYGTKNTLDAYKFNLLKFKEAFINQINSQNNTARTMEEGASEDEGFSYAELCAALSGNDDLIEKAKLDRKIDNMLSDKASFISQVEYAKASLKTENAELNKLIADGDMYQQDVAYIDSVIDGMGDIKYGEVNNMLHVNGAKDQTITELGRALFEIRAAVHQERDEFGEVCGMTLSVLTKAMTDGKPQNVWYVTVPESGLTYKLGDSLGQGHEMAVAAMSVSNVADKVKQIAERNIVAQAASRDKIHNYTTDAQAVWDGEAELHDLIQKRDVINHRIESDLAKREEEQQQAAMKAAKIEGRR